VSLLVATASSSSAQITRIVIDSVVSPAFNGASFGAAGQYETISGRAFGELDPGDARNRIITDLQLAPRNPRGRVEYIATFYIVKPIDLSKSSHFLWNDVPNRGGRITINIAERMLGDIGLSTGWQGDRSGSTARRSGLCHCPGREASGRLPDHGQGHRADLQRERRRLPAAHRVRESDSLPAAHARHARDDGDDARKRDGRRANQRRGHGSEQ
jgi:hypothetical protein